MYHRVTAEKAKLIRQMSLGGWPLREIASQLTLSTTSVHRVLHGQWQEPPDDAADPLHVRAKRCGGCGGMVYQWPCHTCAMRRKTDQDRCLLPRAA